MMTDDPRGAGAGESPEPPAPAPRRPDVTRFTLTAAKIRAGHADGVIWSLDYFPGWEADFPPVHVQDPVLVEVIGPEGAERVDRDGIPLIRFPTGAGESRSLPACRIAALAALGLHGWRFADERNATGGPVGPEATMPE